MLIKRLHNQEAQTHVGEAQLGVQSRGERRGDKLYGKRNGVERDCTEYLVQGTECRLTGGRWRQVRGGWVAVQAWEGQCGEAA